MGSAAKKQRRIDSQILSQFYIESQAGKALLKDVPQVRAILEKLGEPFQNVLPDRELYFFFMIFAWNLSFLESQTAQEELDRYMAAYEPAGPRFVSAAKKLVVDIAVRKQKLYPNEEYTFGSLNNPD